ncbi:GDSL-type esterase/lipase family protein [Clostridium aestuarii]|uniref:GDSL-type esterase/lipase family protein n=1 Tax=Clostridium aestuarii TaxID=338193 RepID=A0ABT4CZ71_9CLOT|nr:GDSL-type esterase/lipase family protein [Clostridium aestuarii]MCY6484122.1 GDSL-type esterase/lipase family protein [Clostridium aestuarii]
MKRVTRKKRRRRCIKVKNRKRFVTVLTTIILIIVMPIIVKEISAFTIQSKCNSNKVENIPKNIVSISKDKKEDIRKMKNSSKDISNKKIDDKVFFKDSVFFGDSITDSLSFYEILDESNVVGIIGILLSKAHTKIDKLVEKNPKNIFILLGANDLEDDISVNYFVDKYKELIHSIKQKLPDSKVYIQSILPVSEKVKEKKPLLNNLRINKFNEAIKNMTKEENINFIDLTSILKNTDKNLYEPDGVHVKYQFYKLWLNYLKNNI